MSIAKSWSLPSDYAAYCNGYYFPEEAQLFLEEDDLLQDMTEDPILRSTTPELDILTPPVLRESLVRSRSDQLFKEAKQKRESEQKVALSPPTERPEDDDSDDS